MITVLLLLIAIILSLWDVLDVTVLSLVKSESDRNQSDLKQQQEHCYHCKNR